MVFLAARLALAAMGLAFFIVSWRVALVVLFCIVLDAFTMLGATLPGGNAVLLWGALLLALGLVLGLVFSIRAVRQAPGELPVVALVALVILRLSWMTGTGAEQDFIAVWPLHLVAVAALPVGLLAANSLVSALGRRAGEHR